MYVVGGAFMFFYRLICDNLAGFSLPMFWCSLSANVSVEVTQRLQVTEKSLMLPMDHKMRWLMFMKERGRAGTVGSDDTEGDGGRQAKDKKIGVSKMDGKRQCKGIGDTK